MAKFLQIVGLFLLIGFSGYVHASTPAGHGENTDASVQKDAAAVFPELQVSINIQHSPDPDVAAQYIFWGDGTKTQLARGQDVQTLNHNYAQPGDYNVQMGFEMTSGEIIYKNRIIRVHDTSGMAMAVADEQQAVTPEASVETQQKTVSNVPAVPKQAAGGQNNQDASSGGSNGPKFSGQSAGRGIALRRPSSNQHNAAPKKNAAPSHVANNNVNVPDVSAADDGVDLDVEMQSVPPVPQATVSNVVVGSNAAPALVQPALPIESLEQDGDLPDLNSGSNTVTAPANSVADLNHDCLLSNADVVMFVNAFYAQDPIVDLAEPYDQFSLGDVVAFLDAFNFGTENPDTICPDGQSPHDFVLPAGDGFAGDIPSVENVGSSSAEGHDAQAIARWDVVPFQTFDEPFEIGVVAFHKNGIDRVEFSLDGGPWVSVDEPRLNPRTGVIEYFAVLDPFEIVDEDGNREDRQVEIQAIVYPKGAGKTRVLAGPYGAEDNSVVDPDNSTWNKGHFSMFLYTNDSGAYDPIKFYVDPTLTNGGGDGTRNNPFATIRQAQEKIIADVMIEHAVEIVLLEPGEYAVATPRNGALRSGPYSLQVDDKRHWITIRGDDDHAREAYVLKSGVADTRSYPEDENIVSDEPVQASPRMQFIKFQNLSTDKSGLPDYTSALLYSDKSVFWFDNFYMYQSKTWTDPDAGNFLRNYYGMTYVTNSAGEDLLYCFTGMEIVRNSSCTRVVGDVFQTSRLIVNNHTNHVDGSILDHHTDLFQEFASSGTGMVENRIGFGNFFENVMSAQNVLYNNADEGFANLAFVNNFVENINTGASINQPIPTDHLVVLNMGNPGVDWVFREGGKPWDFDLSYGKWQSNLLMNNNVFSALKADDLVPSLGCAPDVPPSQCKCSNPAYSDDPVCFKYLEDTMDVFNNHLNTPDIFGFDNVSSGVVYPAKNVARGAYGFGGPGHEAMLAPAAAVHNLVLPDHEGPETRGPVSIFEPCKYNPDPVALIAADPLKIGLGQAVASGDRIEFFSNASYACRDDLADASWSIDGQDYGSASQIDAEFISDSNAEIVTLPFTINIPDLFEREPDREECTINPDTNLEECEIIPGRCLEVDGADFGELRKFYVENPSRLEVGQLIKMTSPLMMPRPLDPAAIYEVAEIHADHIKIKVMGLPNILELKREPFMCMRHTERDLENINSSIYYLRTATIDVKQVRLDVTDTNGRTNTNTRNVNIINTTEDGILFHYDFELPNSSADKTVVDVSGRGVHAQWQVDSNGDSMANYTNNGYEGRAAVFDRSQADHTDNGYFPRVIVPFASMYGQEEITIEFAMKKNTANEYSGDFIYRAPNMLRFTNREDGTTTVSLRIYDPQTGQINQASLTANTATTDWQKLKLTLDGTTAKFFVNGQLQDSKPLSGRFMPEPHLFAGWQLVIGGHHSITNNSYQTRTFNGVIDEFKVYKRAIDYNVQ